MDLFKNREGINLNRRKLHIVEQSGNEIIADIERVNSGVTQEGTPINAENLNKLLQKDFSQYEEITVTNYQSLLNGNLYLPFYQQNEGKIKVINGLTVFPIAINVVLLRDFNYYPEKTSGFTGNEWLVLEDGSDTKKIKLSTLKSYINQP